MTWKKFESAIAERMKNECDLHPDPSHDFSHVRRVVHWAMKLAEVEGADPDVVGPAAYLHDVVLIAKDDPRRSRASRLSAEEAGRFLASLGFNEAKIPAIQHAIEAHSFSAGIEPRTIEAAVVQDADRLDALGAIGIARCMIISGQMRRPIADALDHFHEKLFRLEGLMRTMSGRAEARRRSAYLTEYLARIQEEAALVPS